MLYCYLVTVIMPSAETGLVSAIAMSGLILS